MITGTQGEIEQLALNVYPNPATSGPVTISYYLEKQESVRLEVIDAMGRVKKVAVEDVNQVQGSYSYSLNRDELGGESGIYTIRFIHNGSASNHKLVIMN